MNYCGYCQREFKSVQGLLGHNRMKHNSSTVEYRDSSTGSTEVSAHEYSGPNTGCAEVSAPEHIQNRDEHLFDDWNSSTDFSIAQLEQERDVLARILQGQEKLLVVMAQLVSRITDLEQHQHGGELGCEECHQQRHELVEQGRMQGWKETEAIPGFFEMRDFNEWATQREREHPNLPVFHSWWDVPEVREMIAKYEEGQSVIKIVDDSPDQSGEITDGFNLDLLKQIMRACPIDNSWVGFDSLGWASVQVHPSLGALGELMGRQ